MKAIFITKILLQAVRYFLYYTMKAIFITNHYYCSTDFNQAILRENVPKLLSKLGILKSLFSLLYDKFL